MHSAVHKTNSRKLLVLGILVAAAAIAYLFVDVSFSNERLFRYAMKIRIPKLMVMLVASAAIGGATIVFQTIIHNTIVTPCLLGMNSLYTLIHTAVVFFAGSGSFLAVNANVSFVVDLFLMSTTAVLVYSYLFKKTTGMNFIKYLTSYRVDMAKSLLRTTKLKVGSICEMVGYSNVSYFCQIFKNHCGMTPAQFRGSKL